MSTERYILGVDVSDDNVEDNLMLPISEFINAPENLLINSNFQIWQRFAKKIAIADRTRSAFGTATINTDIPHGIQNGTTVQIYGMTGTSYNNPSVAIIDATYKEVRYTNAGSSESTTADTTGFILALDKEGFGLVDGEYFADRWYCLMEGNYVRANRYTDGVELRNDVGGKKFGIVQIVPYLELKEYLDKPLSLSVDVLSETSGTVYLSLLAWDGTADAPSRDVVDTWNSSGVDPTLVTNWDYIGTEPITLDTDFATVKLENLTIPSGTTNLAIFVHTHLSSSYKKISFRNAQIVPSETVQTYRETSYLKELTNCLRFYQKSYNINVPPFAITDVGKTVFPTSFGTDSGGHFGTIPLSQMYKTPTVTLLTAANPPTSGKWRVSTGSDIDVNSDYVSHSRFAVKNDAGFTVSTNSIAGHYIADAEI